MTDSANNNPKNSFNDFNDELDAMLDKTKSSLTPLNDREDDEDAIDRLLLSDELDAEESHQAGNDKNSETDDIDLPGEFDEFGDDFEELMLDEEQQEEEYDPFADVVSDDETSSPDDEMPSGIEGFFELDDFDEQELESSNLETVKPVDQTGQTEEMFEDYRNDDFLFADFDEPSDRDISDDMALFDLNNQPDIDGTRPAAQDAVFPEEKPEIVLPPISMPEMDEVIAGIKPKRDVDDQFEFDNADMAASSRFNPDQESIGLLQKTLRTEFESKAKKIRVYAYIAMALGSAALIAAIGFGLIAHSAKREASRLSELVKTLEETAGHSAVQSSDKELEDIKASIEQLNQRVDGIMEQLSNKAPLSAEIVKDESIEGVAEKAAEQDPLKDLQVRLDVLESKALAAEAAKSEAIKAEVIKPAAVNEEIAKPAIASAKMKKARPQKGVSGKVNTTADWFVNLIAYRQQWYAKSKAAEFRQKGIPVDVVDVKVGNVTWYRLRVGGFKNRDEATSYATKVKKTLKLSSVWVGNIQG